MRSPCLGGHISKVNQIKMKKVLVPDITNKGIVSYESKAPIS